jgi:uncharacterized membrane protein YjgN (DUF898 family)
MTTAEISGPLPAASAVRFLGKEGVYWRLRIKGAALVVVTLGLYRFWLATDVRRFLWSNTEISGETLEYNGLATELLVGFLLAIAILVPLYMTLAVAALELEAVEVKPVMIGFVLLVAIGEFALYRARRYRLTRTVFRGVRFDQHGSAWNYALRALAWWLLIIVTLGLAYPWAQASLQRFKMRNTSYGDLPGRFEGSGLRLFLRGLPMWLVVVGPLVAAIVAAIGLIDWDALSVAMTQRDDDAANNVLTNNPQFLLATGIFGIAAGISVLALVLLYPLFQAVVLRWWISGLRFGAVTVTSRLRTLQVYRVYLRFILYLVLFVLAVAVIGGVGIYVVSVLLRPAHDSSLSELGGSAVAVVIYVVTMLGASTIYQVVVTAAMWRLGAQSAELSDAQALDCVRATGVPSSALGEGLVDALGVGSI